MATPLDLTDPVAVLLAAVRAFAAANIDTAVYGGLALAVYGEPRETKDADLAVAGVSGQDGLLALRGAGLDGTLAFDRVRFGGNTVSRVTLLGDGASGALNMVDLVEPRSERYARAALVRALEGELRGELVRVLTPEDFILFKVLSTRDRDLEDAASVVRALAALLDLERVNDEARTLAHELADCEIEARLARVWEDSSA